MSTGLGAAAGIATQKMPKHTEIMDSIRRLNEVDMRLFNLLERITGPEPKACIDEKVADSPKQPEFPLQRVLEEAPGMIRTKADDLVTLINGIESALF